MMDNTVGIKRITVAVWGFYRDDGKIQCKLLSYIGIM